jgi:hypothetical protein
MHDSVLVHRVHSLKHLLPENSQKVSAVRTTMFHVRFPRLTQVGFSELQHQINLFENLRLTRTSWEGEIRRNWMDE